MGFKIDDEVDREALVTFWTDPRWLAPGAMPIAADAPHVTYSFPFPITSVRNFVPTWPFATDEDVHLHGAALHMHERGSQISLTLDRYQGRTSCLLNIPQWDFEWQSFYFFKRPVLVTYGDDIVLDCHWNNQGRGYVEWGEGTEDEMCLGVLYVTRAN